MLKYLVSALLLEFDRTEEIIFVISPFWSLLTMISVYTIKHYIF